MKALRECIEALVTYNESIFTGDNLGLRLEKFNTDLDEGKGFTEKEKMLGIMEAYTLSDSLRDSYKYAFKNWKSVQMERRNTLVFTIKSTTKTILGSGNTSVYDFGVNLNKPWGVPFISGTTLKGLVSSYLARHYRDKWWRKKDSAVKSDFQVEVFGGKNECKDPKTFCGSVIFNDAWLDPEKCGGKWFEKDIITVHNRTYYEGKDSKSYPDGMSDPNPIKIAALKPCLTFLVCLEGPEEYTVFIKNILEKALLEEGLGGKTSIGYGRFSVQSDTEMKGAYDQLKIQKEKEIRKLQEIEKHQRREKMSEMELKTELLREKFENNEEVLADAGVLFLVLDKMSEAERVSTCRLLKEIYVHKQQWSTEDIHKKKKKQQDRDRLENRNNVIKRILNE